jgi:hypothetical protein
MAKSECGPKENSASPSQVDGWDSRPNDSCGAHAGRHPQRDVFTLLPRRPRVNSAQLISLAIGRSSTGDQTRYRRKQRPRSRAPSEIVQYSILEATPGGIELQTD